jgi:Gpi18-like mannosyltransferase
MIDKNLKTLFALTVLSKICIVAVIFIGANLIPFSASFYQSNFRYPADEPISLTTTFKTWDAQHYLYLAEQGYQAKEQSDRFFPLYPLLIKVFSPLFVGNTLWTGLFLSNLFSFFLIFFFYIFIKQLFNESTAFISSLFLLAFPTGFYLSLVYTESLLMMLALMFFYFLYRKHYWPAFLSAFLLPLSRPQGILVAGALLVFIAAKLIKDKKLYKDIWTELSIFIAFGAGLLLYFFIMQQATGNFMTGLNLHKDMNVGNHSIANMLDPIGWFKRNFIFSNLILHHFTNGIIDRLFFLGFLALAVLSYKRMDATMFAYLLLLGLIPVLSGGFMSYTRYMLQAFPIFITLALTLKEKHYYLTIPMLILQTIFLLLHSQNYWVS